MYRNRQSVKKYNPVASRRRLEKGMAPCPFCNLEKQEILSESKYFYIVKNLYGYEYWEGLKVIDHLMIVPKRHIKSVREFSQPEKLEFLDLMIKYENDGYNVYTREKDSVMKSIIHQHTHLISAEKTALRFIYL